MTDTVNWNKVVYDHWKMQIDACENMSAVLNVSDMTFTKEQETEGRRRARERLANGPVYYNRRAQTNEPAELIEHTEDTLWPYCIPAE